MNYQVDFGTGSNVGNGLVRIWSNAGTVECNFEGTQGSIICFRINVIDSDGNNNLSFFESLVQAGNPTIIFIDPNSQQEIIVGVLNTYLINYVGAQQLYVNGVILENTSSLNETNYDTNTSVNFQQLRFYYQFNEGCYQTPLLTYKVDLQPCCEEGDIIEDVSLLISPDTAYGYMQTAGLLNILQGHNWLEWDPTPSDLLYQESLLSLNEIQWLSGITVWYEFNCYKPVQGTYVDVNCNTQGLGPQVLITQYPDNANIPGSFGGLNEPYTLPENCLGTGLLYTEINSVPLCNCLQPNEVNRVLVKFEFCCRCIYEEVLCGTECVDPGDDQISDFEFRNEETGRNVECFPEFWYVNISAEFIANYTPGTVFLMKNPYEQQFGVDNITYPDDFPGVESGENLGVQRSLMIFKRNCWRLQSKLY